MLPRKFHNLTMLPTGDVLVTGGLSLEDLASAQKKPQIWNRGAGSWNSYPDLSVEPAVRNYHSAAILLPDGRVLSTGGERTATGQANPHRDHATIFEPPYLFNGNADAQRPVIANAPCRVGYGGEFFISTPDLTSMVGGTVCLIRPGAVTHGFNQDQRYVPLDMYECPSGGRLRVLAPTSGRIAPPGDYLLFIVNNAGVPAIGKWVRVGPDLPAGCDDQAPSAVSDLTAEIFSESEVWFYWSDPPGAVTEFDLRARVQSMTNNELFCDGQRGFAVPGWQSGGVTNLQPCTQYRFRLMARDDHDNWSALSNEVVTSTSCGGGGGGFSAQPTGPLSAIPSVGGEPAVAAMAEAEPRGLVPSAAAAWAAEMRLEGHAPSWSVYALGENEAETVFAGDSAGIVIQRQDGRGGWVSRGRLFPGRQSTRFGLRRLHQPGRVIFRGQYGFQQAWSAVASETTGEVYQVVSARHSRLGDLTAAMDLTGNTTTTLVPGDTLSLAYQKAQSAADAPGGFMLIGQAGSVAPPARNQRALPPAGSPLPKEFALHANQPNPFARLTTIRLALPRPEHVRLEVFDLLGRRVRTLTDDSFEAGEQAFTWDGRDASGASLSAGVYVARVHAGEFRAQRAMVLRP
jgi:hypothetical protein